MSEFLGKDNKGYKYYKEFDDNSAGFSVLDDDERLFHLISFNDMLPCDKAVDDLEDVQSYLAKAFNVHFGFNFEEFKSDCISQGESDEMFLNDFAKKLRSKGLIMKPIAKFEHDDIRLYVGVGGGFDAGVVGLAIASKAEIRQQRNAQRLSKKALKEELGYLDNFLNLLSDEWNGNMFALTKIKSVKDKDGDIHDDMVDCICGIHGCDCETYTDKKRRQALKRAIDELDWGF